MPSRSSLHMRQISRRDLYVSLSARIAYLHAFLDFSSRDIEALISAGKYIKQLIPALVNIVYKKLLTFDITARAFTTRSTSGEGGNLDALDEDSPQIKHRKVFLTAYLNKICSDPSKFEFWEYLDKVGMMHTGIGRSHPLHIEYIHIGACLSFIQDIFTEAILSHPRISLPRKISIIKALGKVIWIQNDLFAKWYVRDGEEYDGEKDEVVIEKEGYVHGVKILDGSDGESGDDSDENEDGSRTPTKESGDPHSPNISGGTCPFTGIAMEGLKISASNGNPRAEISVPKEEDAKE